MKGVTTRPENVGEMEVKGIMIHSIGFAQENASGIIKNWNNPDVVCTHAILQADGTILQALPWNHKAAHSNNYLGAKEDTKDQRGLDSRARSANHSYIGIEMTEPGTISTENPNYDKAIVSRTLTDYEKEYIRNTYNVAVELFAILCKQYNIDPSGKHIVKANGNGEEIKLDGKLLEVDNILSHSQGYFSLIAGNHSDVEHLWNAYNKGEDESKHLTLSKFREDIAKAMNGTFIPEIYSKQTN